MKDEELAAMFEARADALRTAAEAMRNADGRNELLRIVSAYREQAEALRKRRR